MANKRLAGQRALVTGASSGIGAELARVLAAEGSNLVLVARRKERLEALAEELRGAHGIEVRVEPADLDRAEAPQELLERTEGAGAAVDILVNNAGFGHYDDFQNVPWERHRSMLQVNVVALTELTQRFLPGMIDRRYGHVMNVASMGAYMSTPHFAVYTASKAYVRNFTEALDYELKGTGVRAISICPGGTLTEFMDAAHQELKASASMAMMPADRCARIAVTKMLRGRRNVVTGFLNVLTVLLLRFLPRPWMTFLAAKGMEAGVDKKGEPPALPPPAAD